jgi:hypothetical protein
MLYAFSNPQSAIRNPQSAIRNPQSAIRNPQSPPWLSSQEIFGHLAKFCDLTTVFKNRNLL